MNKKFDDLTYGDAICDMHEIHTLQLGLLENHLLIAETAVNVTNIIRFEAHDFNTWIQNHVFASTHEPYAYCNKMLVVIDEWYDRNRDISGLIVAYSYDGRRAGIAKICKV